MFDEIPISTIKHSNGYAYVIVDFICIGLVALARNAKQATLNENYQIKVVSKIWIQIQEYRNRK